MHKEARKHVEDVVFAAIYDLGAAKAKLDLIELEAGVNRTFVQENMRAIEVIQLQLRRGIDGSRS
jgi:hypothetical protein